MTTEHVQEELNADTEIMAELHTQIEIETDKELHYFNLDDVDYSTKWNVRRTDKYDERVTRKIAELKADGFIRTPLIVGDMNTTKDDAKPRGICGFLRHRALMWLRDNEPEFFKKHYEGQVPYRLVLNLDEPTRQRLMMDHGSEEELDMFELYLAVKRYVRQNRTEGEIANILSPLFYKLGGSRAKLALDARLDELRKHGFTMVGSKKVTTIEQARLETWRGKVQYFKRIASAHSLIEEEFKQYCDGDKDAIKFTSATAIEVDGIKNEEEAEEWLKQKRADKDKPRKEKAPKTWGPKKLKSARNVCRSQILARQLDAALGDKVAQEELPDLEDELIRIEEARDKDPDRFWEMVNDILSE